MIYYRGEVKTIRMNETLDEIDYSCIGEDERNLITNVFHRKFLEK